MELLTALEGMALVQMVDSLTACFGCYRLSAFADCHAWTADRLDCWPVIEGLASPLEDMELLTAFEGMLSLMVCITPNGQWV